MCCFFYFYLLSEEGQVREGATIMHKAMDTLRASTPVPIPTRDNLEQQQSKGASVSRREETISNPNPFQIQP